MIPQHVRDYVYRRWGPSEARPQSPNLTEKSGRALASPEGFFKGGWVGCPLKQFPFFVCPSCFAWVPLEFCQFMRWCTFCILPFFLCSPLPLLAFLLGCFLLCCGFYEACHRDGGLVLWWWSFLVCGFFVGAVLCVGSGFLLGDPLDAREPCTELFILYLMLHVFI